MFENKKQLVIFFRVASYFKRFYFKDKEKSFFFN